MSLLTSLIKFRHFENLRKDKLYDSIMIIESHMYKYNAITINERNKEIFEDCSCKHIDCSWCKIQREDSYFNKKTEREKYLQAKYANNIKKLHKSLICFSIKRMKLFDIAKRADVLAGDWHDTSSYLSMFEKKINETVALSEFYICCNELQQCVDDASDYLALKLKYYSALPVIIKESALNKITKFGSDIVDYIKNQSFTKESIEEKIRWIYEKAPEINPAEEQLREEENKKREAALTAQSIKEYEASRKFDKENIVKMNEKIVAFMSEGRPEIIEEKQNCIADAMNRVSNIIENTMLKFKET